MSAQRTYYIRFRGQVQGPFDVAELKALRGRGMLSSIHEISENQTTWALASSLAEVFAAPAAPKEQSASIATASKPSKAVALAKTKAKANPDACGTTTSSNQPHPPPCTPPAPPERSGAHEKRRVPSAVAVLLVLMAFGGAGGGLFIWKNGQDQEHARSRAREENERLNREREATDMREKQELERQKQSAASLPLKSPTNAPPAPVSTYQPIAIQPEPAFRLEWKLVKELSSCSYCGGKGWQRGFPKNVKCVRCGGSGLHDEWKHKQVMVPNR